MTAADDLSIPLGQDKRLRERRHGLSLLQLVAAALGALAITFVGWAMLVEDPLGGESVMIAPVDLATGSKVPPQKPASVSSKEQAERSRSISDSSDDAPQAIILPPSRTITIIDGMSGQRREVVIPAPVGSDTSEQPAAARPAKARRQ